MYAGRDSNSHCADFIVVVRKCRVELHWGVIYYINPTSSNKCFFPKSAVSSGWTTGAIMVFPICQSIPRRSRTDTLYNLNRNSLESLGTHIYTSLSAWQCLPVSPKILMYPRTNSNRQHPASKAGTSYQLGYGGIKNHRHISRLYSQPLAL